ncbi:hypothetical protein, partial [Streptomyces sp. SM5]|uniref:hypothetical protein n=1 Tax=Streptomyces sp. SM5 TaxID=402233 RepID=UPI001CA5DE3B
MTPRRDGTAAQARRSGRRRRVASAVHRARPRRFVQRRAIRARRSERAHITRTAERGATVAR